MANYGRPNTNQSQFFITVNDCPNLDGTNVVFGKVVKGLDILNEMEKFTTDESIPTQVFISRLSFIATLIIILPLGDNNL